MATESGEYLLMKHGVYYRPGAMGYTGLKANAGRYSKEEAERRQRRSSGGVSMVPVEEAPRFSPKCCIDVQLSYLETENALLRSAVEKIATYCERFNMGQILGSGERGETFAGYAPTAHNPEDGKHAGYGYAAAIRAGAPFRD